MALGHQEPQGLWKVTVRSGLVWSCCGMSPRGGWRVQLVILSGSSRSQQSRFYCLELRPNRMKTKSFRKQEQQVFTSGRLETGLAVNAGTVRRTCRLSLWGLCWSLEPQTGCWYGRLDPLSLPGVCTLEASRSLLHRSFHAWFFSAQRPPKALGAKLKTTS